MRAIQRARIFERSRFAPTIAPTCSTRAENIAPASRFYFELRGIIKRTTAVNAEESNLTGVIKILFAASIPRSSSLGRLHPVVDVALHRFEMSSSRSRRERNFHECMTAEHVSHVRISTCYIYIYTRARKYEPAWNNFFRRRRCRDEYDGRSCRSSSSSTVVCHSHYKWFHPRTRVCLCRHQFRVSWMLPAFYRVEGTRNGTTLLSPFRSAMFPAMYKVPRREIPLFLSLRD